jgi:hypothetical protein
MNTQNILLDMVLLLRIFLALKSGLKIDYNHQVITISKKSFNYL